MAAFNKFNDFPEDLNHGVHDFSSDQLKIALCAAANAPSASADSILSDLTQITYTNIVTTPASYALTTSSSAQTSGTYKMVLADITIEASGGAANPFRYIVIYNDDSASDSLICWYDYGSDLTLSSGETLLVDFHATNGFFTLA